MAAAWSGCERLRAPLAPDTVEHLQALSLDHVRAYVGASRQGSTPESRYHADVVGAISSIPPTWLDHAGGETVLPEPHVSVGEVIRQARLVAGDLPHRHTGMGVRCPSCMVDTAVNLLRKAQRAL